MVTGPIKPDEIIASSGVILSTNTEVVRSSNGKVLSPVNLFRHTFTTFISNLFSPVCSQIKMNFFAQNLREVSANLVKNFDTVFF